MNAAWEWNDTNEQKAKQRFGIKHYRAGQRKLIQSVIEGRDTLGILPTGGGKSLCYQLPALFLPRAVLVVSPLISLMQDQQEKLSERNISAAGLNSTLSSSEEQETIATIQRRQSGTCLRHARTFGKSRIPEHSKKGRRVPDRSR